MAQQDVASLKQETADHFVMGIIFLVVVILVTMFYYQYPWYWFNLYLYKALSFVPEGIMKYVFFWASDEAILMDEIHAHLVAHSDDYAAYYVKEGPGYKTQKDINLVGLRMFWVFPVIFLGWFFRKESKRSVSPIPPPGGRRRFFGFLPPKKQNALYEYAKSQKEIWPYIKPVVNRMKEMVDDPSLESNWYALSQLPITWILERELTLKVVTKKVRKLFTRRQKSQFVLLREKTYPVLKDNIGPLWDGLDALDFNHKCLLAVIVPHIFGKTKMSRLINRKICSYYEDDISEKVKAKMRVAIEKEVNEILNLHREAFVMPYFIDTEFDEPYDPIASSFEELNSEIDMYEKGRELIKGTLLTHAYTKTIIFSLLDKAWTYGVLSSAEVLWVKKIDRDLWYVVSQQGRTSSFVEVVGCWSHYLAESTYGFRTLMPQVNEGFRSLDYELYTTHDTYIPHEEWDNSAKWDKLVPSFGGAGQSNGLSANAGRTL
jgi:hypothetical protein